MKKLMRKLVLSSFALGLAVITLSTTTFAWYTANTDVTANGILGSSSTSGSTLLMISADGNTYGNEATVTTGINNGLDNLQPVQYNHSATDTGAPTFTLWNDKTNAVGEASGMSNVLQFKLYFKLSSDQPASLYLTSLTLEHDTVKTLPAKDALYSGREYIKQGYASNTYKVDIFRTLMIATHTVKKTAAAADETLSSLLLDPEAVATKIGDDLGDTFNAHDYYNAVLGEEGITSAAETAGLATTNMAQVLSLNGTTLSYLDTVQNKAAGVCFGELPTAATSDTANDHLEITFYVFINGWDLACFDAVQGQDFKIQMTFSTSDPTAA